MEIPWSEPAELWCGAACPGSSVLSFKSARLPLKPVVYLRNLVWFFILNGALECGLYLHFVGISITQFL